MTREKLRALPSTDQIFAEAIRKSRVVLGESGGPNVHTLDQNLPVTVVGMGAGVIYSMLGGTHHTQEDIAIAGAIPNMQILAPCDPLECCPNWRSQPRRHPARGHGWAIGA